jgi:ubiquinone/menaquinone biosynthesis C-methylase UbiE
MTPDTRFEAVEQFYEFHPISAEQVLAAVEARGLLGDCVTEDVLSAHDQDHYGGLDAVERLMAHARFQPEDRVLDVCSGIGGPARYIAWKTGCRVTGLDLTASRVEGARRLTELAGLSERVCFLQGNALQMPVEPASFTVVMSQEAFAHVPDKPRLIMQCAQALQPGGRLVFSDITHHGRLGADDAARLYEGMRFCEIATAAGYSGWLEAAGMRIVTVVDLTDEWTRILVERHAMYRSLEPQTVARLGRAHFERYDSAYAHFVGLYASGVMSGTLIHAVKAVD